MQKVQDGYRMEPPKICPDEICELMNLCWETSAKDRPDFQVIFFIFFIIYFEYYQEIKEVLYEFSSPYLT